MPPLKSPRREQFAQEIAKAAKTGKTVTQCYIDSGFQTEGRSAHACSARLLASASVKDRVSEILAPVVKKTRVSIESLLGELETTIADAREAKQHTVVVQALTLSAKLCGMLRERIEVGAVGEFDAVNSVEDVVKLMLRDQTAVEALEVIDILRAEIERAASNGATLVPEPARPVPGGEAERSLAYLRPKHRWR
jgi:hypothetical protein